MPASSPTDILLVGASLSDADAWMRCLSEQGFRVQSCTPERSAGLEGEARVLLAGSDAGRLESDYLADTRPTLLIVPQGDCESRAFELLRDSDDVCADATDPAVVAHRLRRLAAAGQGRIRIADRVADWRTHLGPTRVAGLLVIDLDFFSYLNERWGWAVGNELLAEVEARFARLAEPGDRVLRDRDDGFLCLLSAPDQEALLARAGEFQACVGRAAIPTSAGSIVVTASAGLALLRQWRPETAYRQAEIAMFMAKASGRNDLMCFDALEQAHRDGLTGLHNRRYLDTRLKREIALSRTHGTALSLALIDLDDFGLVNKHHGHPAGDLVLRTFAALATRSVRDIDCLARYGGEEFCLIAQATCEQLAEMVERIRQEFSEQTIRGHDGAAIRVTFSAGIVDCRDGEPEGLVHQASLALRQAKESGKNRVTVRRPGA